MNTETKVTCFSCHKTIELDNYTKITRNSECPHCTASLHSCKMCKFYDRFAYNECHESNAERILEKEKANFCDYFVISDNNKSKENEKLKHINAANALFKK